MSLPIKILFVCGRNNRRSPTAEKIYSKDSRMQVRSAGIADTSKHKINATDIAWADLVLVMERKYITRIKAAFRQLDTFPEIESLDISDNYIFMHPELIEELKSSVEQAIETFEEGRTKSADS